MPRIRAPSDIESARQGLPGPAATPDEFGAGIGASAEQLGQAAQVMGVRIADYRERQDRLTVNSAAARAAADWEIQFQDLIRKAPAGAPDFTQSVADAYDSFLERQTGSLTDTQYRLAKPVFEHARAEAIIRAARHEAESSAANNRLLAEQGLAATINTVASNPLAYDTSVATGDRLIGSLNLPNDVREALRRNHLNLLTKAAFEARIYGAKTPQEVDGVLADLATPEWQGRAQPATYDHLLDAARAYRRSLLTARDTATRSAVEYLKDRMNARGAAFAEIDPAEIAQVDGLVRNSADPGVQWHWAQLRAGYDAYRAARRATPDAVSAAIGSTTQQIGLPAAVQDAIDAATRSTGGRVSSSYLSQLVGTQSRDYVEAYRRGKPEFALQPAHVGVDIAGIRQDVREAGQLAGEYFGAPLRVSSGHRNQFYNDAVGGARGSRHISGSALDIDTAGMSPADKGRLVDALVRAGFTGFGQYPTHIHADMRANVPGSYGAQPGWGGWTQLDPEITAVLEKRGFKAGRPSAEIDRGDAGAASRPAAQFNPQPENGLFNFDDKTWQGLVSRYGARLGLPISAETTQADILKLRQDPRIAAQMAAIYAGENRAELQAGLGRDASDAELGMAHVLGPENALVLLRAFRDAPGAPVRDVLPQQYPQAGTLTVGDVYGKFMEGYVGGVDALQHVRLGALRQADGENTALRQAGDVMTAAARDGRVTLSQLDSPDALAVRGRQAIEMQRLYVLDDPRPLTTDEVTRFSNVLKTGTVSDMRSLVSNLQRLGPKAAVGAFRQLGAQNEAFAHVGGMLLDDPTTAPVVHDVLAGLVRMRDNPDAKQVLSSASGGTDNQFNLIVGQALNATDPRVRQAIRQTADALYVERFRNDTSFSWRNYRQAIHAVLNTEIGSVNGASIVLPRGVDESSFDWALDALTPQDLIGMSADGHPPMSSAGVVAPLDISYEGRFQAVGKDTYRIVMADGLPLWSTAGQDYHIVLKPDDVRRLAREARARNVSLQGHLLGLGSEGELQRRYEYLSTRPRPPTLGEIVYDFFKRTRDYTPR